MTNEQTVMIRVKKTAHDRAQRWAGKLTLGEYFDSIIPPVTDELNEVDSLRQSLEEKAREHAVDTGKQLWADAAEKTTRNLAKDAEEG